MKAPSHPALELAPSQSFEAIDEIDALTEIVNIGVGRAAAALSELVEAHVELRVPQLKLQAINDLQAIEGAVNERLSTLVTQDFVGPINGRAGLLFSEESGKSLVQLLAGVDGPITELDIELSGILLEVGNIVLNGVLGSFSNVIGSHFNYSVPTLAVSSAIAETFTELVKTTEAGPVKQILLADVNFRIAKHQIEGSILVVFDLDDVRKLIRSLIEVESLN